MKIRTLVLQLAGVLALGCSLAEATPVSRSTRFGGTAGDTLRFSSQPWFNATVAMTVEAWVYREESGRCETIVSHNYFNSFWLGFCPRLRFYRSGGQSADADVDVPARQWTHVAAAYDGTRVRFYVNGTLVGDKILSNSGPGPNNALNIGGAPEAISTPGAYGYEFRGYLDEIRLWSVARTQTQIRSALHQEVTAGTGLVAVFQQGGYYDDLHGIFATGSLTFDRITGFGVLPRNLSIPRTTASITLDGVAQLQTEYAGAEQMVIRYNDGANARDAVAYLIYRNSSSNTNDQHLYVAVRDLRPTRNGIPWNESFVQVLVDPDNSGGTGIGIGDYYISGALNGTVGAYRKTGTVTFTPIAAGTQTWQSGVNYCNGEFAPACYEFRIHRSLLNNFGSAIGLAIGHASVATSGDSFMAPSDAIQFSSGSYPDATFEGTVSSPFKTIFGTCIVTNPQSGLPISGRIVRLFSGTNSLTGLYLGQTTTGTNGVGTFSVQALKDQPVTLSLEVQPGVTYQAPTLAPPASSFVVSPLATNYNWEVVFGLCSNLNGGCSTPITTFRAVTPPPRIGLTSFTPTNGTPPVTLRTNPLKIRGGSTVRLYGSNLHEQIRVYLSQCDLVPVSLCSNAAIQYRATVVGRDPSWKWIDVEIPATPPAVWGLGYRWLVEDLWVRPGYQPWTAMSSAAGAFVLTPHSYPEVHGFEFANADDGPSLEAFEGTYGESIFSYLPFPPFKIRDPHYYGVWFPIYAILMEASDGSCFGMASTSRLLANGSYLPGTYDQPAAGPVRGVRFANGFLSSTTCDPDDSPPCPPKPGVHSGFDVFSPFRPINIWAQINVNMAVQFTSEAIAEVLGQGRDGEGAATIGDPLGVLGRISANPSGYVLCIKPTAGVSGHCVTPLGVQHEVRLDTAGLTPLPAAGFSVIQIYDNNYPNQTRYIEINRTANLFRYRIGSNSAGPVIWSSPRIYTYRIELFTSPRHAPGFDAFDSLETLFLMIVGGQAHALHEDVAGRRLGWDAGGLFHNAMPGAGIITPFANPLRDRDVRTGLLVAPLTNPPVHSMVHVTGPHYATHATARGSTVQIERFDGVPGDLDQVLNRIQGAGDLALTYVPQSPSSQLSPKVALRFATNSTAVFRWENLSLPALAPVTFEALPGRRGVRMFNAGTAALTCSLRVDAVNPVQGLLSDATFGPFTIAPGSQQTYSWHRWPAVAELLRELDLDADGTPESSEVLITPGSPYVALSIQLAQSGKVLSWEIKETELILEYASSLGPLAVWTTVPVAPQVDGKKRRVTLSHAAWGGRAFFRLRHP